MSHEGFVRFYCQILSFVGGSFVLFIGGAIEGVEQCIGGLRWPWWG